MNTQSYNDGEQIIATQNLGRGRSDHKGIAQGIYFYSEKTSVYLDVMVVTGFIHVTEFIELYTPKLGCLYVNFLNI